MLSNREKLAREGITSETISMLTHDQLHHLGVLRLGDRVKLFARSHLNICQPMVVRLESTAYYPVREKLRESERRCVGVGVRTCVSESARGGEESLRMRWELNGDCQRIHAAPMQYTQPHSSSGRRNTWSSSTCKGRKGWSHRCRSP